MIRRIKSHKFLILVLILALSLRVGMLSYTCIPNLDTGMMSHFMLTPYSGMTSQFDEVARNLCEKRGFVTGDGEPFYDLPPGTSILLAGTYWAFGEYNDIYLRVIQAVIDSFGCLLMFLIGKELFSRRTGLIAAFLYAIWLPIAYLSIWPLHDALMPLITLSSLYFFVKAARTGAMKFYILSGLFAGVGCYFQPTILLLPLMFGLGLFIYSLRKTNFRECVLNVAKVTAVMMAMLVLVVSPWMVRNYHVTGALVFMRSTLWQGIWEGFGEFENPVGAVLSDAHATNLAREALGEDIKPWSPETEAYFRGEVLNTIREYPGWWLSVLVRRFPNTLGYSSHLGRYLSDFISPLTGSSLSATFCRWLGILVAIVPILLGIVAIWAMRRDWRPLILVATVPAYFSVVHMFIFAASYKSIVPGSLGYIIFSAIALDYIYRRIRGANSEAAEFATPPS
ncbi:MAG: hypothetical protein FJ013_00045 [Chloroflexi bacterium]|nr:hypothetical protein [Chloroflexota bacterium]